MAYAKDLVVAGKVELIQMFVVAQEMQDFMDGKPKQIPDMAEEDIPQWNEEWKYKP